jgi:glycosyltransferase involved in cell wall biosynthesis
MHERTLVQFPPRATSRTPRVSVVIPTYNEAKNLPHVFGLLPEDLHEVIVVDGNSVDDTVEVARSLRPDVVVVRQNRIGKGNAMACGFAAVTGDIVGMLDADGSADPREIERYVAALVDGADFAKGTRFAPGGGSADITRVRAWGNRWLNRIANALFGTRYTDLCYGYNAFWAHCLPALELDAGAPRSEHSRTDKLWGDGFEIETLINTRIAKAGLSITEVPSYEAERIHGQSNLNTWRDGLRVLRALLVERFNRKGHDVEIVRTEPRDVAPVIPLPAPKPAHRVITPLDVPAGTVLRETVFVDNVVYDPESYDPGPLARALMAAQDR